MKFAIWWGKDRNKKRIFTLTMYLIRKYQIVKSPANREIRRATIRATNFLLFDNLKSTFDN